jgi:hypothetical protein
MVRAVHVESTIDPVTSGFDNRVLFISRVGRPPLYASDSARVQGWLHELHALVVMTRSGAKGVEHLIGKGVVVCEDAEAFACTITTLLQDRERVIAVGRLGLEAVGKLKADNRVLLNQALSVSRSSPAPAHRLDAAVDA